MSSILDALNKLEQEKAQTTRESEHADTDPISIANDLVGRSVLRDRMTLRVTPAALMVAVGVLAAGLIVVTFSAAILVTRTPRDAGGVAEISAAAPALAVPVTIETPAPAQAPPAIAIPASATAAPAAPPSDIKPADTTAPRETALVKIADLAPAPEATPIPVVDAPKAAVPQPDAAPPAAAPKERPAAAAATPESEPGLKAPSAASTPPTRVAAKATPDVSAAPRESPGAPTRPPRNANVRLDQLPVLTPVDQLHFGFVRIRVNMVKPSGETNPQGSAILTLSEASDGGEPVVNRMKIYEGQRLLQSTLRLFKVEADRVGIEDARSGEQYQLPI
jgi:hypothetical protein